MKNELIAGGIGTALGAIGTATQTNDVLETISLVITILGALISFVIVPLINWHRSAKKDGKITIDELKEASKIAKDGLSQIVDKRDEIRKDKNKDD